ncbi:MAG: acyl-CoA/acyl-ACP dehydrogenase [Robiginitomaculum sp.]|nr:acyl-CoA/acyl-ACP dehydrogenase [Robiginitomaculum sp.]
MDIEFSEQQSLIQNSARNYLAATFNAQMLRDFRLGSQVDAEKIWQEMADLGFMGIAVPEEYDGFGGNFADLLVLLEEMGRVTLPGPFFSTVVYATEVLKALDKQNINSVILPAIASGAITLALVMGDEGNIFDVAGLSLTAQPDKDGYILNGVGQFIPNGYESDYVICAAHIGSAKTQKNDTGIFCIAVDVPGLERKPLNSMNGLCVAKLTFDNVHICRDDLIAQGSDTWPALEQAMFRTAVAKCAEMVGACARIVEIVVEHAKERRQFGKPIGSFQAIQHHCADMLTDLDSARWMMYKTGWLIDEGKASRSDMAMTKVWCNQACRRILAKGHQVMGGIGYCEEHDMPLFYRYIRMAEAAMGTSDDHLTIVAEDLLWETFA